MRVAEELWHVGVALVVVALAAVALLGALVGREPLGLSRRDWVVGGLGLLILAGDAAFGDHRPLFERQWKGTAAALLAFALGIELWRHPHRRGRRASRTPETLRGRVDAAVTGAARAMDPAGWAETAPAGGETVVLTMPQLGQLGGGGTVTRWLKEVGEAVGNDEPLLEVSTDKVDTEVPSPATGTLLEIKVGEKETVSAGVALAVIGVRHLDS